MRLDVRLPLGLLFVMIGAVLAVFGALSDEAVYTRSLGINVNLWWGLVMLVFGAFLLWVCRRRAATTSSSAEGAQGAARTLGQVQGLESADTR